MGIRKRNPVCEKLLKALGMYPKIVKFGPQEEPKPVGLQIQDHEVEKKQKANKLLVQVGGETKKEGKKSGSEDVNDVFSDYISRAKRRLGSISSKRHDSSSSSRGKDNVVKEDHRFSDYIIRARNKLKATSSTSTQV